MATKQFYHNIDLLKVGQLIGARHQNVTSAEQTTLAGTLNAGNKGLTVFNTDLNRVFVWSGTAFLQQEVTIDGDIIFKGVIADLATPDLEMVPGYQYAVGANGTLVQAGVTFIPSAIVHAGDQVLVVSATEAYVINRNIDDARIDAIEAKNLEQDGRLNAVEAEVDALQAAQVYSFFGTANLTAGAPATVTHGLNLSDKDAFVIRTSLGGSDISVDVDSVDANSLTLTSLVALTGVAVTVIGR